MSDYDKIPPVLVCLVCLSFGVLSGCGGSDAPEGPKLAEVTGKVMLGDEPLAAADVTFVPTGTTDGIGGSVRTDETGAFADVLYARGGTGLPTGTYKVSVSKRMMPDGTPVPEGDETPAIESPAKETLPPYYSNPEKSKLEVVIEEGKPIELKLKKS
jgi:hypothetical protein